MYTKKNGRMTFKSNRRVNFKRNNNYTNKGRNKGNITQQYNKYLKLAKDTFSAGDRIQAEYYYQFTDHYYRLMLELGINLDENESSVDFKDGVVETTTSESQNANQITDDEKLDEEKNSEEGDEQSIESIPFISEPLKKKRSRSSK